MHEITLRSIPQILVTAALLLLTNVHSLAQSNECAGAPTLTVNPSPTCTSTTTGTSVGATQSRAGCLGTADDDVWYKFVATGSTHTVTVTPGTMNDVVFEVFSGTCAALTSLQCVDDTAGSTQETRTLTGLTAGATYFVRVYSYNSGIGAGTFTICVSSPAPAPANNNCAGATALTVNAGVTCTSSTNATSVSATQSQAGCVGTADDDVWFKFTATGTTHTVTVTPTTMNDVVLQVFSGACGSLTSLQCIDATVGSNPESVTLTGLTNGATYHVRVYSYSSGSGQGTFNICVTTPVPITNNDCAGATALTVNPTSTCTSTLTATSVGATQSQAGCSGTADDDVWFKFTATGTTHGVSVTTGTMTDAVFQVFSGACGSLTSLACVDGVFGTGTEQTVLTGLTAGNTYYVRVYSWGNATGSGTFTICVNTIVPLANDNCNGATTVAVNTGTTCTSTVSGTTVGATQSQAGCFGTADDDVWYTFTATSVTHIVTVTPGTMSDAVFQVFGGTCAGLTSLVCMDSTGGTSVETTTVNGLTIGTTYWVRVYSWGSAGAGTFTLCVGTPVPLTNDNCSGAITLSVSASDTCTTSLSGTTLGATQSQAGCVGTADDDVWYRFVATSTTHTVTAQAGTIYDITMEVFSGVCGSLVSVACIENTTGSDQEAQYLTGLTVGATYFIRIYSYFNFAGDAGTFTLCVTTNIPCTAGSGTGVTDLGCPSVLSGGLGLNGADPSPLDCSTGACVSLEATYLQLGQTTSYAVEAIPYAPPYQFECLANPVSVNVDDVWSPVVNLPFNFCFYGNTYNQCLISSNGVITFDMANNTPTGPSTWSFSNNIPNATLFRNSIFGVYHDIDPSLGGDVGWELITLNTGCRALVAAWHDIPMFSFACNSKLYTGMIVLYENTNIIDVYIEEKQVCDTWNSGNAIVGLQNASGTAGVAAPGRNGLDADWTVYNEAWRFRPAGTSITSLKWFEGTGTSGPMIGTSDVINVCPNVTTTYTAEVTYTLCNGTLLTETETTTVTVQKSKIWNGSVSTDWNTAANWTPVGVPTSIHCVVIPDVTNDCIISGSGYLGYCYSLEVLNGGSLTINSNNNLTVTNTVDVQAGGVFNIMNSGSLIQIDNVANTGNISMQRTTQPMFRYDFTYWNSPLKASSNFTLGQLSPLTLADKYFSWTPSVGGASGNWAYQSPGTVMDPGKGYIVRAPQTFSTNPAIRTAYTATFVGTPNNGPVNSPISFGTLGPTEHIDKWNLIGNPYPSAVSGALFLNHPTNAALLDGTIYYYTHNTPWSTTFPDPFYGDYVVNYTDTDYAAWNKTGAVGTAASTGGPVPNGYIAAGQSVFIRSRAVPGAAVWNNTMRVPNYNNQFFRMSQEEGIALIPGEEALERHRIWLNLTNEYGSFNQFLVGYVEGATSGWDIGFDGTRFSESDLTLFSMIPGEKLAIEGRPLPFHVQDQVPLGYSAQTGGSYAVKIDHVDGLFHQQRIYLEDKLLKVIHDLKQSPYQFVTQSGVFEDRFVLRFTKSKKPDGQAYLTGLISNNRLMLQASDAIREVEVYDLTGKLVRTYKPGELSTTFEGDFFYDKGIYMAKVKTTDGDGIAKVSQSD